VTLGRVSRDAWAWYLIVAVAASGVSLSLGPVEFQAVAGASAAAAVAAGIRWHRPAAAQAWRLVAVAQATASVALTAWALVALVTRRPAPYPTGIDIVYLGSYVIFAAGLALFVRRRAGRSPWEGVLDAGLVTLGLGTLVWVLVADPNLDASGAPPLVLVTALAYPAMDLLLLAMLAWLVFTAGLRTRSLLLLAAAVAVLLAADVLNSALAARGGNANGNNLTLLGWDVSYALLGAAALHPSMAATIEPERRRTRAAVRWRVAVYLCLAVAGPTFTVTSVLAGDRRVEDTLAPLAMAAAISVLLVVRLAQIAGLASDRAEALDRQAAELERSRQALLLAHQRVAAIFRSAPTGMAQLARDRTILAANPALALLLGQPADQLAGQSIEAFVHPDDVPRVRELLRGTLAAQDRRDCEIRLVDGRGNMVWASWVASAVHEEEHGALSAIVVIADRTEARRLEIELRHAQKLEAIGRLAAGVAHELNTPIQFIGDNVDFLGDAATQLLAAATIASEVNARDVNARDINARDINARDINAREVNEGRGTVANALELDYLAGEIPDAVRQTREGVARVTTIVQALKSFAHPAAPGQRPADLNRALTDTLTVARSELRRVDRIVTDLGELPLVTCSAGDLNQVLLNLLINAADAAAETQTPDAPGQITVRSRQAGDQVVIEVSDTGPGIPDELRDRIYEPFFTTKPVGRGTGQGLALARNVIVERHGGTLGYTSIPGQGTTFTITLPVRGRGPRIPQQRQLTAEPAYERQA
jgi:PAS domain S-box-containing protein